MEENANTQTQTTNTTPEAVKTLQMGGTQPATTPVQASVPTGSTPVQLGETGPIDVPQMDMTQFIGRKVAIDTIEEFQGQWGFYVTVTTKPLDEKGSIRARKNFRLDEDKDKKIGWGAKSELAAFLKKYGVDHYRKLSGKEVLIQTKPDKKNKEKLYLTFI